ncbi:MAG: hypothetical protein IPM39_14680 [Chloroflexi bacterium]|nr:hypothetical protein [Chloroflexota bacterium]
MSRRRRRSQSPAGGDRSAQISAAGLFLLGLVIGLIGALYYAWVIAPVVYTDASPARFSERYKAEYIYLVSESFAADGDWQRASERLAALGDEALAERVDAQLEGYLRAQRPAADIEHLAQLAQRLGAQGTAVALFAPDMAATRTPTPAATDTPAPTPTHTAVPSPTAQPSATPTATTAATATPQPNYRLLAQERVCLAGTAVSRIEVETLDALLNQLPGVEVIVRWDSGEDRFFTGFKPEQGAGYGDFSMTPSVSYSVALVDGSPEISGLRIEPCTNGRDGGWRLTFQNLRLVLQTPEAE